MQKLNCSGISGMWGRKKAAVPPRACGHFEVIRLLGPARGGTVCLHRPEVGGPTPTLFLGLGLWPCDSDSRLLRRETERVREREREKEREREREFGVWGLGFRV